MFKHNKYARWYFQLVQKARERSSLPAYVEKHHVVPFCISRSNAKENIVKLSGREHFIAHLLLIRAVEDSFRPSMIRAIYKMMIAGKGQSRVVSSRTFELARRAFGKQQSEDMKARWADPARRKEHGDKLRKTLSTPESKKLKREAALRSSTPEINEKKRKSAIGRKHSPETIAKMRATYAARRKAN